MAKETGLPHTAVRRIWLAFGLQSHREERFKLSSDPLFVDKNLMCRILDSVDEGKQGQVNKALYMIAKHFLHLCICYSHVVFEKWKIEQQNRHENTQNC